MKKVLLINAKKQFGHSAGDLNQHMSDVAKNHLQHLGLSVKTTLVEQGYNIDEEVEKILWADVIIYQMPGWWMGTAVDSEEIHR